MRCQTGSNKSYGQKQASGSTERRYCAVKNVGPRSQTKSKQLKRSKKSLFPQKKVVVFTITRTEPTDKTVLINIRYWVLSLDVFACTYIQPRMSRTFQCGKISQTSTERENGRTKTNVLTPDIVRGQMPAISPPILMQSLDSNENNTNRCERSFAWSSGAGTMQRCIGFSLVGWSGNN